MALIDTLLFGSGEQGLWLDPSDITLGWRKNLLQRTEEFDNGQWQKPQSTVIANDRAAPDATMKADRVTFTAGTALSLRQTGLALIGGETYAFSAYVYVPSSLGWTSWRFGIDFSDADNINNDASNLFDQWVKVEIVKQLTGERIFLDLNMFRNGGVNPNIGDHFWITEAQLELGSSVTSYQKIRSASQTYIDTVQAQPILFQDNVGINAVYDVDQPIGLILDKSKGLALGAERAVNGALTTDTNWTKGAGWTIGSGVATKAPGVASNLSQAMGLVMDKTYKVTFDLVRNAGVLTLAAGSTSAIWNFTSSDSYVAYVPALGADATLYFMADANFDGTIDNISVKEIAGNHLRQSTGTARPTFRKGSDGILKIEFDGIDDFMSTRAIDFSATDELSIFAGIEKLSDATQAVLAELSINFAGNNNTFTLQAPSGTLEDYMFGVKGTAQALNYKQQRTANNKALLTCLADISADSAKLRCDGVLAQETSSELGSGNFASAHSIYVGMRAGTGIPFKGHIHQLIIRGKLTSDADVVKAEDFIAPRLGYSLPELGSDIEARIAIHPNIILANKLDVNQIDYKPNWRPEYYFQFGSGANQANKVFTDIRTIGASSSETIDLSWTTLDAIGKKLNLTKIKALLLIASENNSNDILLGGNTAAPVTSFFGAANDKLRIKPGGMVALIAPDANGYAVVQATADKLDIANDGGGSSVTYSILIMGVSS